MSVPARPYGRGRNLARGVAVLGIAASIATGTWAVEQATKPANTGLSGIVSTTVPTGLTADDFAKLDGNWSEWSAGAAAAVADFHTKLEGSDAKAQRAALGVLKAKLDVMRRALDDKKYASLQEPLASLHSKLARRIEFSEAILDTLELDPAAAKAAKVANASKSVQSSINELETYLNGIGGGRAWFSYVKADGLRSALTAGALSEASLGAAKQTKEKLAARAGLKDETQKQFLGRPAFVALESAIDRLITASEWQPAANSGTELRDQLKALSDAADSFVDSRSVEDTAKARAAYNSIRKLAVDGGDRMSVVLQKQLFNYNVRIIAAEEFLNRLLSDARVENGQVVDNVLGAAVSGSQTTSTNVGIDLRPSPNTIRFDLGLSGTVQSNTVGVTDQASVSTIGYHRFFAAKEVNFDGKDFKTSPATISVNPHNTTTGISTNVGFLFQGIARKIASQQVEAKRGQAEAIAASRIQSRVLPVFNSEVDSSFADAGTKLEKELFSGLRATGLYPDAINYQSTDNVIRVNSRLMGETELAADLPETTFNLDRGATLMLHESAINNTIDRMGLAGKTLNDAELKAKIEEFLSKALSRSIKLKEAAKSGAEGDEEKTLSAISFAPTDPLRVRIENGELSLVIRAGFKQEGKDDIPMREIVAPIAFEVKGDKILATRGTVEVSAVDGGGFALNGVIRKKIQSVLPDRTLEGKFDLKGPKKTVQATVSNIKLANGWVSITVN